jgi:CHASE3 domain sensor protein
MRNALQNKTPLVMFALALVLATCISGFWVWNRLATCLEVRFNARQALIQWQITLSSIKDLELGARGFVLAGSEEYLQPFSQATKRLPHHMDLIDQRENALDNGLSTAQLVQLQRMADEYLAKTREVIIVARREGQENALDVLKTGESKVALDAIRQKFTERIDELDAVVQMKDEELTEVLNIGGKSIAALGLAAVIAAFAAFMVLREAWMQARRAERLAEEKLKAERANKG